MLLGNKQFIHALGDMHISSMNPTDRNYDEFNTKHCFLQFASYLI